MKNKDEHGAPKNKGKLINNRSTLAEQLLRTDSRGGGLNASLLAPILHPSVVVKTQNCYVRMKTS